MHFGNIASSNQLQISATERNRIQQQHEAIYFEMEAAGVMEEHPCVVIRGICDYADSHYAAATAAAYAKGLLSMIPAARDRARQSSASGSPTLGLREVPPRPSIVIPFARDTDFVEREKILDQVHQRCGVPGSRAALVGLGGVR